MKRYNASDLTLYSAMDNTSPRLISTTAEGKVPIWQQYAHDDEIFKKHKPDNNGWRTVNSVCADAMERILTMLQDNPKAYIDCTRPGESGRGNAQNFRLCLFAGGVPQKRAAQWDHQMNCIRTSWWK